MLTAEEIAAGKLKTLYSEPPHHEHDDCIRMAYEWLDAQTKLERPSRRSRALKHIIEHWAGRYISRSDVEVAATIHPGIRGKYPLYNISAKLVLPSMSRLSGIGEAGRHPKYRDRMSDANYATNE